MLKVYQPTVTHGFEWVNAVDPAEGYEALLQLDGRRRGATWKPVAFRRVAVNEGRSFEPSDFPWLGDHALILRRSAVEALRDLFEANGELLPLATDDGVDLFVFNANTVDALDEANSDIVKFPGTERIMLIKRVAFDPAKIAGRDLFRLPHRAMPTYVSERFVERVKAAGLRGLEFDEVWSG